MPACVSDLASEALDEVTPIVRFGQGVTHGRLVKLVRHPLCLGVDDRQRYGDMRADVHAVPAPELRLLDALSADEGSVGRFEVFEQVASPPEKRHAGVGSAHPGIVESELRLASAPDDR